MITINIVFSNPIINNVVLHSYLIIYNINLILLVSYLTIVTTLYQNYFDWSWLPRGRITGVQYNTYK